MRDTKGSNYVFAQSCDDSHLVPLNNQSFASCCEAVIIVIMFWPHKDSVPSVVPGAGSFLKRPISEGSMTGRIEHAWASLLALR